MQQAHTGESELIERNICIGPQKGNKTKRLAAHPWLKLRISVPRIQNHDVNWLLSFEGGKRPVGDRVLLWRSVNDQLLRRAKISEVCHRQQQLAAIADFEIILGKIGNRAPIRSAHKHRKRDGLSAYRQRTQQARREVEKCSVQATCYACVNVTAL